MAARSLDLEAQLAQSKSEIARVKRDREEVFLQNVLYTRISVYEYRLTIQRFNVTSCTINFVSF